MPLIVTDHGDWVGYTPQVYPTDAPPNAMFCRRVTDHVDWYDFSRGEELNPDTIKMTIMQGKVQAVVRDTSYLFPQGCKLLEVEGSNDADPQAIYGQRIYYPATKTFGPAVLTGK